jgi:hypothetical protein
MGAAAPERVKPGIWRLSPSLRAQRCLFPGTRVKRPGTRCGGLHPSGEFLRPPASACWLLDAGCRPRRPPGTAGGGLRWLSLRFALNRWPHPPALRPSMVSPRLRLTDGLLPRHAATDAFIHACAPAPRSPVSAPGGACSLGRGSSSPEPAAGAYTRSAGSHVPRPPLARLLDAGCRPRRPPGTDGGLRWPPPTLAPRPSASSHAGAGTDGLHHGFRRPMPSFTLAPPAPRSL